MKTASILFILALCLGILLAGCSNEGVPTATPVVDLVANADKLFSESKQEEAFALYTQDIQNNRDLARAYAGRGNIYAAWRRFDEAISDFTQALNLVRTPEVLSGRCNVYRLLSKFELAKADCQEALQLKPDYADGYIATALLQLEQKKDGDALKTIQEGSAKNPDFAKIYLVLYQVQFKLGNLPGSFDALNKAVELQPKEAQYYCERGLLYYSTAQLDKSREDYLKAIEVGIDGKDDECIYKAQGMLKMLGNKK